MCINDKINKKYFRFYKLFTGAGASSESVLSDSIRRE